MKQPLHYHRLSASMSTTTAAATAVATIDKILAHQGFDTPEKRIKLYEKAASALIYLRFTSSTIERKRDPFGVLIIEGPAGTGKSTLLRSFEKALADVNVSTRRIDAATELKDIKASDAKGDDTKGAMLCLVCDNAHSKIKLFGMDHKELPASLRSVMYATRNSDDVNIPRYTVGASIFDISFNTEVSAEDRRACTISDEPIEEMFWRRSTVSICSDYPSRISKVKKLLPSSARSRCK
jgi:hypothetical protein